MENKNENKILIGLKHLAIACGEWFFIPLVVCLASLYVVMSSNNTKFTDVLTFLIGIGIIVYIVLVVRSFIDETLKNEKVRSPIIISLVFFILTFISMLIKQSLFADVFFIIGVIFAELYLLYYIIKLSVSNNENLNISKILIFSILFISIGFGVIYYSSYDQKRDLFNALVSIFSALIGGGITLAGVAWTIKHEREEKRKDEVEKAKPYFTFNMLYDEPKNITGLKICIPENLDLNYLCDTYAEIENSNQSVMILNRIYHDGKWGNLEANNMLVHGGKLLLNFRFDNPNNIILEVKDVFNNLYYYILNVLHTTIISGSKIGVHTIRSIKEISKEDVNKIENKAEKSIN